MGELKQFFKDASIQVGSGGAAGFVEVCIMHPLDVVKTRLQLQNNLYKSSPQYYSGIVDCIVKMRRSEGVYSLWKGILPPIIAETPKRAVKFVSFEQYKRFFMFGSPTPTPLTFSLAGALAGLNEACFVNPFEVVKVSLQSDKNKAAPGTWRITRSIILAEGIGGLYKGVSATIYRNMVFNGIYFGFYHSMKHKVTSSTKDKRIELLGKLGLGFTSGILGSCMNIPFDVAKSRIQGPQPVKDVVKYKSTGQTMILILREEGYSRLPSGKEEFLMIIMYLSRFGFIAMLSNCDGDDPYQPFRWKALYKGLLPKVMRLGPGGGIMLVVYEHVHAYLTNTFN